MSRMDRYHNNESDKKEKSNLFSRRKLNQKDQKTTDYEDDQDSYYYDQRNEQEDLTNRWQQQENRTSAPSAPTSKPPKKRKKKKHRLFRFILKLLVLLVAYSGISFVFGQRVAKKEGGQQQNETFHGFSSSSGDNNILLLGSDSREGENSRADAVMVLQLDGPAKKPKLISFMRDTLVTIPDVGETKLNAAYAYGGAELVRKTLSQNFGIESKYYTTVDFHSFEKVIDTLFPNGVYIDAEKDMSKNLEVSIKKGPQNMDGLTLLQYARFRMDEEGDFGRVRRQQQVINGIFSEMKNPITLFKLPYAAGKVMGYAGTDLSMMFLTKNIPSLLKGAKGVDRLSVPVEDSWYYGTTYDGASVLVVDNDMNRQALQEFLEK